MDTGSQLSLVFPGIIMEFWVLSHFPSLLLDGFVRPFTYPAVRGWATCVRSGWGLGYEFVRKKLNEMTIDDTRDPVARREQFREGESTTLLLPDEDYVTLAWSRLVCGSLEEIDEDMEHQPSPDFSVEYEDMGVRHTYELPPPFPFPLETDVGMDS